MNCKLASILLTFAVAASCTDEASTPTDPENHSTGGPDGGPEGAHGGVEGGDSNEHGASQTLGSLTVAGFVMTVIQSGGVEAGKEAFFDLQFAEGVNRPDTVRAWVGIETGVGSRKSKFMKEPGNKLHGHVDVPDPLTDASQLWVEIELDSGPVHGSIALHR